MQNAILRNNIAAANMISNSERMMPSVSFGNSQPLRPSFNGDVFELNNKVNETKISYLNKLINSLNIKLGKAIKRSAPKYTGLDSKV